MHAVSAAPLPQIAIFTHAGFKWLTITIYFETVIPNIKKIVFINISLNKSPVNIRTCANIAICQNRANMNTGTAKKYLQTAYENSLALTGYAPYNSEIHYLLGMIAIKEGRKLDAILAYMELKNTYDYTPNGNDKKVELYKAIQKMDE